MSSPMSSFQLLAKENSVTEVLQIKCHENSCNTSVDFVVSLLSLQLGLALLIDVRQDISANQIG